MILSGSVERVFSADEPVEEVPLGVYIVRGDNIVRPPFPALPPPLPSGPSPPRATCRADAVLFLLQTLIGEVDTELDKQVDLATVRAEPISELQH